jgi:hypothetical protein
VYTFHYCPPVQYFQGAFALSERVYTTEMLLLEVSTPQGPELHLIMSALKRPVLLLEVSTPQGPVLQLNVSTLQRPVLLLHCLKFSKINFTFVRHTP